MNRHRTTVPLLSLAALSLVVACASDPTPTTPTPPGWATLLTLDAAAGEHPEGLVIHDGHAYVGLAPLGQILELAPDGSHTIYGRIPPGGADGSMTGLAFDADDNLYVLATRGNPQATAVTPAIYRLPPTIAGGLVTTPFATAPELVFPNGIALDDDGRVFVTDSATGRVLTVGASGELTTWASGPLLAGEPACPTPVPFPPLGANGIVVTATAAYVANTTQGALIEIAINPDGSAGDQRALLHDCAYLGLDGLARGADGRLWIAQNGAPGRIIIVGPDGSVAELPGDPRLDGPASIALTTDWAGADVAIVTNSAFISAILEGATPHPSVVTYGPLR